MIERLILLRGIENHAQICFGRIKMRRILFIARIITISATIFGCAALTKYGMYYKEAEKSYKQGDYDKAVSNSVASLKEKPDYEKSIALLNEAAPLAYEEHKTSAEKQEAMRNWDGAVHEYRIIEHLVNLVSSVGRDFPTIDVSSKREKACQNAAESHYQQGLSFLNTGQSKDAAVEFRRAKEFVPSYKDCETLYTKARQEAIKRIAVMPFEDLTGKEVLFGSIGDLLTSHIISAALNSQPEFLEFVTRDYLNQLFAEQNIGKTELIDAGSATQMGKILGVNVFVFGKVLSIISNYPQEKVTRNKGTAKVYEKKQERVVYAAWEAHEKRGSVKINASYQIIDAETGRVLTHGTPSYEEIDVAKWARYEGDERALPRDIHELCTVMDTEIDPPEALVNKALTNLGDKIASEITGFFK